MGKLLVRFLKPKLVSCNVCDAGSFTLKSGRESPYFFNAGAFDNGEAMRMLGQVDIY